MKKYAPICCYFGRFSNYFPFFLKSCSFNKTIDFHIVTDNDMDDYDLPENVHIINLSFEQVKNIVVSKFPEIDICLDRPYKICDFKVAYGYLFEEYIVDYEYWGIFDVDLIFGDIMSFLPDNENGNFVKMLPCGHLMFVKNEEKYRQMFRMSSKFKDLPDWKVVFSTPESYYFDEHGGFDQIFYRLEKEKYFNGCPFDNIMPPWKFGHFLPINYPRKRFVIYVFEFGRIYRLSLNKFRICKEELMYVHFSKRKMNIKTDNLCNWMLVPNSFVKEKKLSVLKLMWIGRPRRIVVLIKRIYTFVRKSLK